MDQDSVHMVAASKVPMLKPGEYEIWRMRIEQYIQIDRHARWEVVNEWCNLQNNKNHGRMLRSWLEAIERIGGNVVHERLKGISLKEQYETSLLQLRDA
ncbi:hypothetical protein Tco_1392137 [Tanacetum coccineum]